MRISDWSSDVCSSDLFTAKELGDVQDPNTPREINSVADLTFGEYVRLLQNPENWTRLDSRLDRAIFCGQLERVSMIRNQVMHFEIGRASCRERVCQNG